MGESLDEIAKQIINSNKKVQLIYAFMERANKAFKSVQRIICT